MSDVCLSFYLLFCHSLFYLLFYHPFYLSIYRFVCISIILSVCHSIYLANLSWVIVWLRMILNYILIWVFQGVYNWWNITLLTVWLKLLITQWICILLISFSPYSFWQSRWDFRQLDDGRRWRGSVSLKGRFRGVHTYLWFPVWIALNIVTDWGWRPVQSENVSQQNHRKISQIIFFFFFWDQNWIERGKGQICFGPLNLTNDTYAP